MDIKNDTSYQNMHFSMKLKKPQLVLLSISLIAKIVHTVGIFLIITFHKALIKIAGGNPPAETITFPIVITVITRLFGLGLHIALFTLLIQKIKRDEKASAIGTISVILTLASMFLPSAETISSYILMYSGPLKTYGYWAYVTQFFNFISSISGVARISLLVSVSLIMYYDFIKGCHEKLPHN